ncbi:MAG: DedA family protein [Planctomycetes bacterium]|nr:DedA family protein [Planctomycetota bacterium]
MIGGLADWVGDFIGRYNYEAPFVVLLLCGIGLPLPEEVTLIGSGLLLYKGHVEFWKITLVCSAAILIGDSIPFWLGRKYGMAALRLRWVSKILHPERFAKIEKRFKEHGNWATFAFRFFAGLRIPGYFVAGTFGMSYARFLLLDSIGVLLSVPASIWLGKFFGEQTDRFKETVHDLHLVLAFVVLALVLIFVARAWIKRRSPEA